MKNKYIIFDNLFAVCFTGALVHAGLKYSNRFTSISSWDTKVPTSAGFFSVSSEISYQTEDGEHWPEGRVIIDVTVYGESESLGLESKPRDAGLIKIALGLN